MLLLIMCSFSVTYRILFSSFFCPHCFNCQYNRQLFFLAAYPSTVTYIMFGHCWSSPTSYFPANIIKGKVDTRYRMLKTLFSFNLWLIPVSIIAIISSKLFFSEHFFLKCTFCQPSEYEQTSGAAKDQLSQSTSQRTQYSELPIVSAIISNSSIFFSF
jgi:hypothetical protein